MARLATGADSLDRAWDRFQSEGLQGKVVGDFDRGWYAFWTPGAIQGTPALSWVRAYNQMRTNAETIRTQTLAADEAARQAGVLPGVRRELRQKYRLDCQAWGL